MYWVRPLKIIEKLDFCKKMVREREKSKLMSVTRKKTTRHTWN